MSIYQHKSSPYWHYDFVVKGRRIHGSTRTKSKRKAEDIAAAVRERAVRGEFYPDEEKITLDVAAQNYWEDVAKVQPSAETTDYQLANLIRLIGKDVYLSEITDKVVADFMRHRRGEKSRNGGLISPSSVNREVQLLRRVMYRARKIEKVKIPEVEWKDLVLQEPDPPSRPLTEDQETRLLEVAAEHIKAPIRFSLLTGVRLGNAIGLDWSQIDMRAREITFHMKSRKPGGKVHVLPISETLLVLLANQGPRDRGPVFTYKGRKIKSWRTAWETARRKAGIEKFRWHDMRHTVGTRLIRHHDITVVQDYLGHADIATTQRYVHHDTGAKLRAMEALSRNSPESDATDGSKTLENKG